MEKKWLIVLIILAIIVVLGIIILLLIKPQLSPNSNSNLETCNSLSYSSSSAKNLVFFATEKQAREYSQYLESISPYNQNSFNIYFLDYSPECELYQGKAVLCYNSDLIKKASSCPNDIIIVIKDYPRNIRSSAYMNVISINSRDNKNVLIHEMGHALAFLSDEYVPSTLPRKSENCQKTCDLFKDCFQGCGKEDYYRSINSGVMKTLSTSDYGIYNENLISKYLLNSNAITGNVIENEVDCSNQQYYLIQGVYSDNKITMESKSIEQGCLGNSGTGDFSYNLILNNKLNYTGNFNPEFIFTDSSEGGEVLSSDRPFLLKVQIVADSKLLEIRKESVLAKINLQDIDSRPCKT